MKTYAAIGGEAKAAVPLEFVCKGSTLPAFYLGLDVWTTIGK